MAKLTYITGGARSGKSRFALLQSQSYRKKLFIATAQAFDEEMKNRIEAHQTERDASFETIEAPIEIARVVKNQSENFDLVLIDCISVWLGNLVHFEKDISLYFSDLVTSLENVKTDTIVVSNEVGLGIVPENKLARHYRDLAGRINQQVAAIADEAYLLVSGRALKI